MRELIVKISIVEINLDVYLFQSACLYVSLCGVTSTWYTSLGFMNNAIMEKLKG